MKDFHILEGKIEVQQKQLKKLNELQDNLTGEIYDLWKECTHAHKDYEDLKKSKHDLWIECENHKNFVEFLNDKLLKNEILKGQPQDIVKCNEEIGTLKTTLAKFVGGIENLDKLLRYGRCSTNKSSHGYEREIYVYDEHTVVCYFCVKVGHMTSRCMDLP